MTLSQPSKGSTATTASEVQYQRSLVMTLLIGVGLYSYHTAFTTGDIMEIRFYVWGDDPTAGHECLYYVSLTGATSYNETAICFPPVQTTRYKLTFKRTAVTDRTFKWQINRQNG